MLATMVETWLDNHLEHTQYKIMAIIAGQINPANYPQPDYSGVVSSAQMQAQGLADIGKSISGVIDNFGAAKKEQKKVDAYNKASAKSIEAAITLGESYKIKGVKETLNPFLESYNDPNLSPIEKAALLDEGKAMIPNVFGRFDQSQANAIQQAQVNARGSSTGRSVNLQQGEITETIGGKQYKIPVIFDPSTGETRRLDGTTVGAAAQTTSGIDASQTTSGINAALNLPIPALTGNSNRDATAINNAQQLPSVNEMDNTPAIMLTGGMPDGQGSLANASPVPVGSPTVTQQPKVDGIPGFIPDEPKEEGVVMTEEDVIKLINKGFKVSGRPLGDGKVFVTNQDSLAPQKGQEITYNPDGTVAVRDISLSSDLNKAPTTSLKEGEALVPDPNSPTGTKVVQIPSEMREKAQTDFSTYISQVGDSYAKLNEMGKAVSAGEANPLNYVFSTAIGQTMGRMFGEKGQPLRDQINTMAPNIINVIRQSTQMGSKGMDSNAEREFYIKAMGDPILPIEANIKALEALDKAYGKGNAVENMLKNYPELAQKVNKYKLSPTTEETGTTGDFLDPTERALKDKYKPSK